MRENQHGVDSNYLKHSVHIKILFQTRYFGAIHLVQNYMVSTFEKLNTHKHNWKFTKGLCILK